VSDLFAQLDAPTAAVEGGYSNNPNDPGGETNHGITIGTARANGYAGRMVDMTEAQAQAIRRAEYYAKPGIYLVAPLSMPIAQKVYDTGVNMGTGTSVMFLQRALNVLNRQGADYPDVIVDGDIGPATAGALQKFLILRSALGVTVMLRALNCLQGAQYIAIAESRAASETFEFGWLANRIGIA
jgi:lysozyme family protein